MVLQDSDDVEEAFCVSFQAEGLGLSLQMSSEMVLMTDLKDGVARGAVQTQHGRDVHAGGSGAVLPVRKPEALPLLSFLL